MDESKAPNEKWFNEGDQMHSIFEYWLFVSVCQSRIECIEIIA